MKKKRLLKPVGEAKQKWKIIPPNEVERKIGQIVLDFANAETSDSACFKHFENLQEFMSFSSDFAEKTKEAYPAFFPLHSSLMKEEREFLELIIGKESVKYSVNKDLEALALEINRYDAETSILTVWELDAAANFHDGYVSGGFFRKEPFELTVEQFKAEIDHNVGGILQGGFLGDLDEYVEIQKQISELERSISESRINKLKEIVSDYEGRKSLHNEMIDIQAGLRFILDGIVAGDGFDNIDRLTSYIAFYNNLPTRKVVSHGDMLTLYPPIDERDYLDDRNGMSSLKNLTFNPRWRSNWTILLGRDLAYCLVEFLIPQDNRNYIGKCLNCERYFIAAKYNPTNPNKFCRYNGDKCRFDWHNKRKIKSGEAALYMKEVRAEGKYQ